MRNFLITTFLFICTQVNAQMYLSLPLDRSVFQRSGTGDGSAVIVIAGQVMQHPNPAILSPNFTVKYRFVPLDKNGVPGTAPAWTQISSSTPYGGNFRTFASVPTGWYLLQTGAFGSGSTDPQLVAYASVGVGEVVFIAGQSNAQGIDGTTNDQVTNVYYDCVNSISDDQFCKVSYKFPVIQKIENTKLITPNGNRSAWGFHWLGKKIADGLVAGKVVPTVFFNTAMTGSSVENWVNTANNASDTENLPLLGGATCCDPTIWPASDGTAGQPYKALRSSLNYFGAMFGARGVIWHQGESDKSISTTTTNYQNRLTSLIASSRSHFNTNLKWAISRVSYHNGATSTTITTAQQNVKTGVTGTSTGAWFSDTILARSDNTHFNYLGLRSVNNQYYDSFNTGNSFTALKSLTPIAAISAPTLTIVKNGSPNATLTAPTSASYCWVQNNGNKNSCYATTQSISVPNSTTASYRCYVADSGGNITLSGAVYMPMWSVGGASRISAEEKPEFAEAVEEYTSVNIFPNPSPGRTTASVNLKSDSNIRFDILNSSGVNLVKVADGPHAAGKYTFSINTENLPNGIYLTVLKVGDMYITNKLLIAK